MQIQKALSGPVAVALGVALAHVLPVKLAYRLCDRLAHGSRGRQNSIWQNLYGNLKRVVPSGPSHTPLEEITEASLAMLYRTYYEMLRDPTHKHAPSSVHLGISQERWSRLLAATRDDRGLIIAGAHMSNFDLAATWLVAQGVDVQALSLSRPDAGTRLVNRLRVQRGIGFTPIDVSSLRAAHHRLKAGGTVLTGVDRVTSDTDPPLSFFGEPARLPRGHVRMALATDARIVLATCYQTSPGEYEIWFSELLEMERVGSRQQDIEHNMARTVRALEEMILRAPEQWLMIVPVWDRS